MPIARRLSLAMGDIKLAHSIFAMPFAILGAFLVAPRIADFPSFIDWAKLGWMLPLIVACMVFARTCAMLFNRLVDAKMDIHNPRTAGRAFATGELATRDGWAMLSLNAIAFMLCCAGFGFFFGNWYPLILAIPVLVWIGFYSLTKRFTWLCHLFLGSALAISPIAAGIAVGPDRLMHTPAVFWIAAMVLFWVGGFDMIYALQDLDFDRKHGVRSIPARFGWKHAAWMSRLMHLVALGALAMAWRADDRLDWLFGSAIVLVVIILIAEHATLAKRGRAGIPMVFFTLNGIVSVVLGIVGCVDIVL